MPNSPDECKTVPDVKYVLSPVVKALPANIYTFPANVHVCPDVTSLCPGVISPFPMLKKPFPDVFKPSPVQCICSKVYLTVQREDCCPAQKACRFAVLNSAGRAKPKPSWSPSIDQPNFKLSIIRQNGVQGTVIQHTFDVFLHRPPSYYFQFSILPSHRANAVWINLSIPRWPSHGTRHTTDCAAANVVTNMRNAFTSKGKH